MPKNYSNLSRGGGKSTPARKKYVRSYLKSKGVTPTKDASMRSTRERKLRAKARMEFAAKGRKGPVATRNSSRSDVPTSLQGAYANKQQGGIPTSLQGAKKGGGNKSPKRTYPSVKKK